MFHFAQRGVWDTYLIATVIGQKTMVYGVDLVNILVLRVEMMLHHLCGIYIY